MDSLRGKFDHTATIMIGCSTLYINDLAQTFIDRGASRFLGWDATVGMNDVEDFTPVLLQKLLSDKVPLGQALSETLSKKGADPDFGASLNYFPQSSGGKILIELLK